MCPKIAEGNSLSISTFASLCVCKLQSGTVSIYSNWKPHSHARQRRQAELLKDVLEMRVKPLVTHVRNCTERGAIMRKNIRRAV